MKRKNIDTTTTEVHRLSIYDTPKSIIKRAKEHVNLALSAPTLEEAIAALETAHQEIKEKIDHTSFKESHPEFYEVLKDDVLSLLEPKVKKLYELDGKQKETAEKGYKLFLTIVQILFKYDKTTLCGNKDRVRSVYTSFRFLLNFYLKESGNNETCFYNALSVAYIAKDMLPGFFDNDLKRILDIFSENTKPFLKDMYPSKKCPDTAKIMYEDTIDFLLQIEKIDEEILFIFLSELGILYFTNFARSEDPNINNNERIYFYKKALATLTQALEFNLKDKKIDQEHMLIQALLRRGQLYEELFKEKLSIQNKDDMELLRCAFTSYHQAIFIGKSSEMHKRKFSQAQMQLAESTFYYRQYYECYDNILIEKDIKSLEDNRFKIKKAQGPSLFDEFYREKIHKCVDANITALILWNTGMENYLNFSLRELELDVASYDEFNALFSEIKKQIKEHIDDLKNKMIEETTKSKNFDDNTKTQILEMLGSIKINEDFGNLKFALEKLDRFFHKMDYSKYFKDFFKQASDLFENMLSEKVFQTLKDGIAESTCKARKKNNTETNNSPQKISFFYDLTKDEEDGLSPDSSKKETPQNNLRFFCDITKQNGFVCEEYKIGNRSLSDGPGKKSS